MNMIARGVTETFAVFLLPVQQGLGVSRPEITLTYSVFMLAYGAFAPFAGQLIDRFGARATYGFGLTSLGCGYVLAGSATELWQYLLGGGLARRAGLGIAGHDRGLGAAVALVHEPHRHDRIDALRRDRRRHADPAAADAAHARQHRLAHGASAARGSACWSCCR